MDFYEQMYKKNLFTDSRYQQKFEGWEEDFQGETVNLMGALFDGYMGSSNISSFLAQNPSLGNVMQACGSNMFKAAATTRRLSADLHRRLNSAANAQEEADVQELIDALFSDDPEAMDSLGDGAQTQRLQYLMDKDLEKTLDQGAKADDAALKFSGRGLEDPGTGQINPDVLDMLSQSMVVDILDQFGRFDKFISRTEKTRRQEGIGEVKDVVLGDDIEEMFDDYYMELLEPELEILFFEAYAEEQLMQFNYEELIEEDSGPVCIMIDVSGSMGSLHAVAAGFALAFMQKLQDEGRYGVVHTYSTQLVNTATTEHTLVDILAALTKGIGGGTKFSAALKQARAVWSNSKYHTLDPSKADLIVLTDGEDVYDLGPEVKSLKEEGMTLNAVYIGAPNHLGQARSRLSGIFDTLLTVDRANAGQDLQAKLCSLIQTTL